MTHWSRGMAAVVLAFVLISLGVMLAGCPAGIDPTPTPTRTLRPPTPTVGLPSTAGIPVTDWSGEVLSYPQADVYDDYFLRSEDGRSYGITARDLGVSRQLDAARNSGRRVIIDGVLYQNVGDVGGQRIVVDALRAGSQVFVPNPATTATPPWATPSEPATATATPTASATATPTVLSIPSPLPTATPVVLPTPAISFPPTGGIVPTSTPTPRPLVFSDWKGEYYANTSLQGTPVLVRNDVQVNFDWGTGSPGTEVPADGFSARWTGRFYFAAGDYQFMAYADDGVRVYLDNFLVINEWHQWQDRTYSNDFRRVGEGFHTVVVEFVDFGGRAAIWASWQLTGGYPEWRGEYFNSRQPGSNRVLERNDPALNFDWGLGSPDPVVRVDGFSARWTRRFFMQPGDYRFWVHADDGIRVWLDDALIINEWYDGVKETSTQVFGLSPDYHSFRVEYYDNVDFAKVRFWWDYQGQRPGEPLP